MPKKLSIKNIRTIHEEARNKYNNQIQIWNNHNTKAGLLLAVFALIMVFTSNDNILNFMKEVYYIFAPIFIAPIVLIFVGMKFKVIKTPPKLTTLVKKYYGKSEEETKLELIKQYVHASDELTKVLEWKAFCLNLASYIIFLLLAYFFIVTLFLM